MRRHLVGCLLVAATVARTAPVYPPDPLLELVKQKAWDQVIEQARARLTDNPAKRETRVAPLYIALATRESGKADQRQEIVKQLLAGRDFAWKGMETALPVAVETLCGDHGEILYGGEPRLELGNWARYWTLECDGLTEAGYPDTALLFLFRYLGYATGVSREQAKSLLTAFVKTAEPLRYELARRLAAHVTPERQRPPMSGRSSLRYILLQIRQSEPAFTDKAQLPIFVAVAEWDRRDAIDLHQELQTYRTPLDWEADAWREVPRVVDNADAVLQAAAWFGRHADEASARQMLSQGDSYLSPREAQRLHWLVWAAAPLAPLREAERQRWATLGDGDKGVFGRVDACLVNGDTEAAKRELANPFPETANADLVARWRTLAQVDPAKSWEAAKQAGPAASRELQPALAELGTALGVATSDYAGAADWLLTLWKDWRNSAAPLTHLGGRIVGLQLLAGDEARAQEALLAIAANPRGLWGGELEKAVALLDGSDPKSWKHAGPWLTQAAAKALKESAESPAPKVALARVLAGAIPRLHAGESVADLWRRVVTALPEGAPGADEAAQQLVAACAGVADGRVADRLIVVATAMLKERGGQRQLPAAMAMVKAVVERCKAKSEPSKPVHDALNDLGNTLRDLPNARAALDDMAELTKDWCPDLMWKP